MDAHSANIKIISYDEFLALYPSTPRRKYKNGYYVQCSAHGDKDPSLLIEPSNNPDFTVDFKCFAGCTKEAVLKSVNLTWDNIRANHNGNNGHKPQPHKEIEAIYDYKKGGKLNFQVVRTTNPKGFFQRRPDDKGDYINNLDGIEPFLYYYGMSKEELSDCKERMNKDGE